MTTARDSSALRRAAAAAVSAALGGFAAGAAARPNRQNEPTPRTAAPHGAPGRTAPRGVPADRREPDPAARSDDTGDACGRPAKAKNEATRRTLAQPGAPWRTAAHHAVLEPRQVLAVRLLLSGMGVSEVAAAVGVTRHAVGRWKRDPLFQDEVRRVAADLVPLHGTRATG